MERPALKTGKWLAAGCGCAGLFLLGLSLFLTLRRTALPAGPAEPAESAESPFVTAGPTSAGTALPQTESPLSSTSAPSPPATFPSQVLPEVPAREFTFPEEGRAALDALLAGQEGVSVYYQDVGSGATYEYRPFDKYPAASVVKAPYCMYVLDLVSQGRADLNQTFTYTEEWKRSGTGKIQDMPFGTVLTLRELIRYAIEESDNVAFALIRSEYPASGYRVYAEGFGLTYPEDVRNGANSQICARDAGAYLAALDQFIRSHPYGSELKAYMQNTRYPLIRSSYPIARKYGWMEGAYHDMAIVYAPHPYRLAILSDHDGGTEEDRRLFREISLLIERYSGNA